MTIQEQSPIPGRSEIVESGNEWRFSNQNSFLRPDNFPIEIPYGHELTEPIGGLLQILKSTWISTSEEWLPRDVLGNDRSAAFVFVNPERTKFSEMEPEIDFLRLSPRLTSGQPKLFRDIDGRSIIPRRIDQDMNPSLEGTNLRIINAIAGFNTIPIMYRRPVRRDREAKLYQTGVAFIWLQFQNLAKDIILIEDETGDLKGKHKRQLAELKRKKDELSKKLVEDPKLLFNPPTI